MKSDLLPKRIAKRAFDVGRNPLDTAGMDTDDEEWMGENPDYGDYVEQVYQDLVDSKRKKSSPKKEKPKKDSPKPVKIVWDGGGDIKIDGKQYYIDEHGDLYLDEELEGESRRKL